MKTLRIALLILSMAVPAEAQQTVICNPGQAPGSLVCQQQVGTAKRVALVATVIVAGTLVVLAVKHHKRHKDLQPRGFPAPSPGRATRGKEVPIK
jgi:hypothetical protein